MNKVIIIAEAGVNHNGDEELAFKLVDAAVDAGADIVKFQTFKTENIVTKDAPKAGYQKISSPSSESQYTMLKKLELSHEMHYKLASYCDDKGIQFLSTAFDFDSLHFLLNNLGLKVLKIPSGEITNGPLILSHARTKSDLIVSTGMATVDEIEDALGVIAFGFLNGKSPNRDAFKAAYHSNAGQEILREKVTLLHCTSEYPAPFEDINLNAMLTMKTKFDLPIGYSDHSQGITVPIAAASLGAVIIEKHFTLDKKMLGPDHASSLEPNELKAMVEAIRVIELVLGDGVKKPGASELNNRNITRKSLVAATNIEEGEIFTSENVSIKRPGTGIQPLHYWDVLGRKSTKSYLADELLS